MLLLHLLSNPIQTWQKHLTQILLWTKTIGLKIIDESLVLMTSQHNTSFLTNTVPFFKVSFKKFAFLKQIMKKYAIVAISTKKKIIWDIELINSSFELTRFIVLLIFLILRHHDVIMILFLHLSIQI